MTWIFLPVKKHQLAGCVCGLAILLSSFPVTALFVSKRNNINVRSSPTFHRGSSSYFPASSTSTQSLVKINLFRTSKGGSSSSSSSNSSSSSTTVTSGNGYSNVIQGAAGWKSFNNGTMIIDETVTAKKERLKPKLDAETIFEFLVPFLAPLLAYMSYEFVATGYSDFVNTFSNTNWIAVDGGALQAKIIAPAINGLVAPAIAILYATLTSTTISTLRQRQVEIRRCINMEAGELRNLGHLVYSYPAGKVRSMCRAYLAQYAKRIIRECQPPATLFAASDTVIDPGHGMDTELNGFLIQMHEGYGSSIPTFLGDESFAAIARLRTYRLDRITALQCTYPVLHYILLALLAMAECVIFLMETNQDVLFFLNAFQLKLLWSILVGTFTVCFTIFYDFQSPFAGSYQISASVEQLHFIRKNLESFDTESTTNGAGGKAAVTAAAGNGENVSTMTTTTSTVTNSVPSTAATTAMNLTQSSSPNAMTPPPFPSGTGQDFAPNPDRYSVLNSAPMTPTVEATNVQSSTQSSSPPPLEPATLVYDQQQLLAQRAGQGIDTSRRNGHNNDNK